MALTITPFETAHHLIVERLIAALPDTNFLLTAPFIIPYSDVNPTTFTVTANIGDVLNFHVNGNFVTTVVAQTATLTVAIPPKRPDQNRQGMVQGRNYVRVTSPSDSMEILVAATNYMTVNQGWAEQFFNEAYLRVQRLYNQLNSRWSLRQVEHQIAWQDLLPNTRVMRTLAGKMAIKSFVNMGGTNEGVLDIAKAVTGNSPVWLPTLMDQDVYEPEARLLYSSAHDFGGYEFNIWLFNLCATSWQAFIILANNMDDSIMKLLSVTDQVVRVEINGVEEQHNFDAKEQRCQMLSILTEFLDCFSQVCVFVNADITSSFSMCAYSFPLDLAVDYPIGRSRFDLNLPLDQLPPHNLDSCEDSDPFCDGWLGLSISCRFDQDNCLDSMGPAVGIGSDCPEPCCFGEPCVSMANSSLIETTVAIPAVVWSRLTITV